MKNNLFFPVIYKCAILTFFLSAGCSLVWETVQFVYHLIKNNQQTLMDFISQIKKNENMPLGAACRKPSNPVFDPVMLYFIFTF